MSAFVLIHGSMHGAWCWDKVVPLLATAGQKVVTPDLPAHGRDKTPPGQHYLEILRGQGN